MNNNNEDKKRSQKFDADEKLELAQKIAQQSERLARRYEAMGMAIMRVFRWFSAWFDRILFNPRHSKIVAFGLALLIYISFNTTDVASIQSLPNARVLTNVPVVAIYNTELYEVSGIDETVEVQVIGDLVDLSMIDTQSTSVELDLSGLTEGVHQVNYSTSGFSSRVQPYITPTSTTVTIRRNETKTVTVGYDFINQDKLSSQYILGEPVFETTEVTIRASAETLESIAFVKALIDVTGQTSQFTTDATIVAYNQSGVLVESVDIIPRVISVTVDVTSPNKTVPIVADFQGNIPNNMAVSSVTMDHEAITIYAPQSVLDSISEITIPIQATTLTSETNNLLHNIVLPSGVRFGTVTRVNINVNLAEGETRQFDVPINYISNVNSYRVAPVNREDVYASVEVFGTTENLDAFSIDSIYVYINMRDIEPGENIEGQLYVRDNSPLLQITLLKEVILFNVLE